jgi:hypothetical protein
LIETVGGSNRHHTFFVFFTDDTFALGPVHGAANVVLAIGGSIAGVVTLFVHVRKCSFTHVAGGPNLANRPIVR